MNHYANAIDAIQQLERGDVRYADVIYEIAKFAPKTIVTAMDRIKNSGWRPEVERLARAGQKIDAIKLLRAHTQLGLKEAKDYVDAL